MATIKRSRQRDAILSYLMSCKNHPTAEAVYENVKKQFPNISLGTVYRNLAQLVELGHVARVPCADGSEHFDGDISPHYHFQCLSCGSIQDLQNFNPDVEQVLNAAASSGFEGSIYGHQLFFFGLCPNCFVKKVEKKVNNTIDIHNKVC